MNEKNHEALSQIIERMKAELSPEARQYIEKFSSTVILKPHQAVLNASPSGFNGPNYPVTNTCRAQDCLGGYTNCPNHESNCPVENCPQQTCDDHQCKSDVCGQKACRDHECGNVSCRTVANAAYRNINLGNAEVQQLMSMEVHRHEGING